MRPKISFLVIAAIAVLAACHGNQSFTPLAQQQQASARTPQSAAACNTPTYSARKPFVVFIAQGNVKHDDFKSKPGISTLWFEIKVKRAAAPTPSPSGSPSTAPSPTAPPTNQPLYLYFGQYTLAKTKQSGCLFLFATQSGKPFTGSKTGAFTDGAPRVKLPKYYKERLIAHGPVNVAIGHLSATGGSGKATLLLTGGGTFDTANLKLTSRLAEP